eukprot:9782545-Lingulodinium_polyedra.AAC.1
MVLALRVMGPDARYCDRADPGVGVAEENDVAVGGKTMQAPDEVGPPALALGARGTGVRGV